MNSWTVITSSVEAAFQWNDDELQIMQMWIYVGYLLVMLPFAWLMDKKGLFCINLLLYKPTKICPNRNDCASCKVVNIYFSAVLATLQL